MRRVSALTCAAAVAALSLLPANAATVTVRVTDDEFEPRVRRVAAGDRVRWRSNGEHPHSVTSQSGQPASFDSTEAPGTCSSVIEVGCLHEGDFFDFTMPELGRDYSVVYYCRVHGRASGTPERGDCAMCGRIEVVSRASDGSPTPRPTLTRSTRPPVTGTSAPLPGASATGTPSGDASPQPTTTDDPLAARDDGGGGSGRVLLSLALIAALLLAGRFVWQRMIADDR